MYLIIYLFLTSVTKNVLAALFCAFLSVLLVFVAMLQEAKELLVQETNKLRTLLRELWKNLPPTHSKSKPLPEPPPENEVIHKLALLHDEAQKLSARLLQFETYLIFDEKTALNDRLESNVRKAESYRRFSPHFSENFRHLLSYTIRSINQTKKQLSEYNELFVEKRKQLHNDLLVKGIALDEDQKEAVIKDDKHNLVIAGAGAGKTEVLVKRIAYLVKRKPDTIKPNRVLALAFQTKAAKQIRERLSKEYSTNVEDIRTFHSLGRKILEESQRKPPRLIFRKDDEKEYRNFIIKLFKEAAKEPEFQRNLLEYLQNFYDEPPQKEAAFQDKATYFRYLRNLCYTTLDGNTVRSIPEKEIYNFLYSNTINGKNILVCYEAPAEWMEYTKSNLEKPRPDFFLPEFDIYIEHWALDEKNKVPAWFETSTESYIRNMQKKKEAFKKQNKFFLVETNNALYKKGTLLKEIKKRLVAALKTKHPGKQFIFSPKDPSKLVEKVWEENKSSFRSVRHNIPNYIRIAKTHGYTPADIRKIINEPKWTENQRSFANLAIRVFELYETELRKQNRIDYCDMINLAIKELEEKPALFSARFDQILVDEYQDISNQRYQLIRTLMKKNPDCKLFCVGDDWQGIMAFAGANLGFFVNFENYFKNPAKTVLKTNYRSLRPIVELGNDIIKHNPKVSQIQKKLTFNTRDKNKNNETRVKTYLSTHRKEFWRQYYEQIADHCMNEILTYSKNGFAFNEMMLLYRITNPILLERIQMNAKNLKIPLLSMRGGQIGVHDMTVHKSKGLQARVVFILNARKDLYGFPCELENPTILETAQPKESRFKDKEEEERRLFYVAVTRAKEEVVIYSQYQNESKFLEEISPHLEKINLPYSNGKH